MDEIKDTKSTDQISRFLGGHAARTNPFGLNASGEKAYRRAERLVAALYLLSSHIPADEPLRRSVRAKGLELLSRVLAIRDEMRNPGSARVKGVLSLVRELISLTRMLGVSGSISMQNADVVVEALDELGNFLTASQRSALSDSMSFLREDFLTGSLPLRGDRPFAGAGMLPPRRTRPTISDIKDTEMSDRSTDAKAAKSITHAGGSSGDGTVGARARAILDILRSGGELGIRDVASNLPEYSEKMIQRELAGLVAVGKAKKTGSKRWSRYSLA